MRPEDFVPVIIESPFAGDVKANKTYLRACMRDCLLRGEAPFASHGLYTQRGVLFDGNPFERELGIMAGFAWRALAVKTIFCLDRGTSKGMIRGREHVDAIASPFETRLLGGDW